MSAGIATEAVRGSTRAASPRVWASYARLSRARNDGRGSSLAIGRQHRENRAYIERVDPSALVVEFSDDGFSGFLEVERPAWSAMMARVEAGEFAAVVAWHADRISRQVEVTARIVKLCANTGVELHTSLGGWHADPTRLYIESVMAENESRQKRERQLAKHKELREAGAFPGGPRRFGYEAGMRAVRESEAVEVLDMAGRVLGGESLKSIASDLNNRGVLTSTGGRWRGQAVRQVLERGYLAARLPSGGRAAWEPILDAATFEALGRFFSSPSRKTAPATTARKYLLSGIVRCGRCSSRMQGSLRHGRLYAYRCECGIQRPMLEVNEMVTAYTIRRLEETDANGLLVSDALNRQVAALVAERDRLAEQRAVLVGLLRAGKVDAVSFADATAGLAEREGEVAAELEDLADRQAAPIRALDGATGPLAAQTWQSWTEDPTGRGQARQRAIIDLLWTVTLHPVGRGRRAFNPDTVTIAPKTLSSE